MAVERDLRAAGFTTSQSDFFADPQTGEFRELDVTGSHGWACDEFMVGLDVIVECKSSRTGSFLLFTAEEAKPGRMSLVWDAVGGGGGHLLRRLARRRDAPQLAVLRLADRRGYGFVEALKGAGDAAYRALMTVTKAATARAKAVKEYDDPDFPFLVIYAPTIVVDAPFYECHLGGDGEVVLNAIDSGTILWRNPASGRVTTPVRIVHAASFADYARNLALAAQFIDTIALEDKDFLIKRLEGDRKAKQSQMSAG